MDHGGQSAAPHAEDPEDIMENIGVWGLDDVEVFRDVMCVKLQSPHSAVYKV